jgi:hypothetical protein
MTRAVCIIEPVAAIARIYADGDTTGQHSQVCTLQYRPDELGTAWITAHTAHLPHTRDTLRALVRALRDAGLKAAYFERRAGHRIPGAVDLGNGIGRYDMAHPPVEPQCHT